MTAIEAMDRDSRIYDLRQRMLEDTLRRKIEQSKQLQHELNLVAAPFNHLISDIYARSTFTITFNPGGPLIPPIWPPETVKLVADVRAEQRKAMIAHIDNWERRKQGLNVLPIAEIKAYFE